MADNAALTPVQRRLVAYLAGIVIEGYSVEGIFDFDVGSRFPVAGSIEDDRVDISDETDGLRLTGTLPHLEDAHGTAITLHLVDDDEFAGETPSGRFHGRVAGRNIDLFDDAAGTQHTMCL